MRNRLPLLIVAIGILAVAPSTVFAQNCPPGTVVSPGMLEVNDTAALEGDCGLEVIMNGASTKRFVQDDTPDAEHVYRVSFLIHPNDIDFDLTGTAIQAQHNILDATASTPNGNNIGVRLTFQHKKSASRYQVKAKAGVYIAGNPSKVTRKTSPAVMQLVADPAAMHLVELEWQAASADGVRDGLLRVRVDGGAWSSNTLDNFDFGIDTVKFGAVNGIDTGTTGSYFLDDFQSFRTLTTP
ncbi:MAG: hypothetical protein GY906_39960 [bacterium]|nr:hypothetical protein [bacterium]